MLVPLAPDHLPLLRTAELATDIAFRWRHGGRHPSPEEFYATAWSDVLCSFLIFRSEDPAPHGIVSAYHADFQNGHCRVAATRLGTERRSATTTVRGLFMLFDYLFKGWAFRKLYLEIPEFNLDQFVSAEVRLFDREGTLVEYCYYDDKYWDLVFLALARKRWVEERQRYARFIGIESAVGEA